MNIFHFLLISIALVTQGNGFMISHIKHPVYQKRSSNLRKKLEEKIQETLDKLFPTPEPVLVPIPIPVEPERNPNIPNIPSYPDYPNVR